MNNKYHCLKSLLMLLLVGYVSEVGAQSNCLEYWFDDDFAPVEISMGSEAFDADIGTSHLPPGIHALSMRVRVGGEYSPVSTSPFLKFAGEGMTAVQYWFDDDFGLRTDSIIELGEDGITTIDNLSLADTYKYPMGLHRLNIRVVTGGGNYSPIYTATVMKLPYTNVSQMTYWLDDDYDKKHTVVGMSKDGVGHVTATLDFSQVAPGMHRLNYRVASNGVDDGVIYCSHVLISKLYSNQETPFIQNYTFWGDDNSEYPVTEFLTKDETHLHQFTIDPNDYSVGTHVRYVAYQNSAGVWSEKNATYFQKEENGRLRVVAAPVDDEGITSIDDVDNFDLDCTSRDGNIIISGNGGSSSRGTVSVYDLAGRFVVSKTITIVQGAYAEIDMSSYKNQTLIVRLSSGDKLLIKKLVLK